MTAGGSQVQGAVGHTADDEATTHVEGSSDHRRLPLRREPPAWLRRQLRFVLALDAAAATGATLFAKLWAFGPGLATVHVRSIAVPYSAAVLVAVPLWLFVLAVSRCHDLGPFGFVQHEARRVVRAGAHFLAVTAIIYYIVNVERVAREFLIAIIPLAVILTLLGRWLARRHLLLQRQRGHADRRAIFLGPTRTAELLVEHLTKHPHSGLTVAVAPPEDPQSQSVNADSSDRTSQLPVAADTENAIQLLPTTDADLVVVTGALGAGELRKLTWQLEGTSIDVLVAPATGQLAGPQLDVRPVAGLPLLYVDR